MPVVTPSLNRRTFLQALVAAGASWVIDADASDTDIDTAWAKAQAQPWVFEINESNTLVDADAFEPQVWGDVFDICTSDLTTAQDIVDQVDRCEPLRSHFQGLEWSAQYEVLEKLEEVGLSRAERKQLRRLAEAMEDPDCGWEDCVLYQGKDDVSEFQDIIKDWLSEPIDWMQYDGEVLLSGGQGQAYRFFRSLNVRTLNALGVVLIEGEHPGSSYWAAELRESIASANAAAQALHLPIRFRQEGLA